MEWGEKCPMQVWGWVSLGEGRFDGLREALEAIHDSGAFVDQFGDQNASQPPAAPVTSAHFPTNRMGLMLLVQGVDRRDFAFAAGDIVAEGLVGTRIDFGLLA